MAPLETGSSEVAFRVVDAMLRDAGKIAVMAAGFNRRERLALALRGFIAKYPQSDSPEDVRWRSRIIEVVGIGVGGMAVGGREKSCEGGKVGEWFRLLTFR